MWSFRNLVKIFLFIDRVNLFIPLICFSLGLEEILTIGFEVGERTSIAEAFEWSIEGYFVLFNTLQVHYII